MPVIAGAGSNSTKEAVELAQHAEKAGANAVLVVTPYYNKPTQEGMYQHFKAINDAIGIPIIIYNIPPRSVIDMSVDTMKRLWELKNIAGVKDATASMVRVSQQRAAMGEDFNQLSGEDATILGYMAHGGHGCISVTSNVAPRLCSEFQAAWAEGRSCHRAEAARQADAAAQQPLHREQSGADQVCAVAARQDGRDAAAADGAGLRADPRCRAQRHGACRPDQLRLGQSRELLSARPTKEGRRMLKEFREFAMKGNVVDLAVGVIIGAAFGAIVTSLVGDIIMPIIGAVTGGLDFSNYFVAACRARSPPTNLADAKKQGAVLA